MQRKKETPHGVRIQYVSDLHLEFPENRQWLAKNPLETTGDILLVAGDTAYLDLPDSNRDTYSAYQFWDWASKNYSQVIVCFGNHEFYGFYDLATMPNGFCKEIRHNVYAYYNSVVHLDGIDIIVSTLWSTIKPYDAFLTEKNVSDFHRIKFNGHRLTADDFSLQHERCLAFIQQAISVSDAEKIIVVTHHVPTQLCTAAEFQNSSINGAFTVELGNFIAESRIDYWIYGHSHRNIKAQIGNTVIMSNQLGYVSDNELLRNGFSPSAMIEL